MLWTGDSVVCPSSTPKFDNFLYPTPYPPTLIYKQSEMNQDYEHSKSYFSSLE